AGSYNLQSVVEMCVQGIGQSTRFAQIVALMESASLQKPRLAQLADRIARPFLILVLIAAVLAALWWWPTDPGHALMVAVSVLIVTCPCALSLATPVAMLSAAGTLARHGVLVRNLQGLEALAEIDTVVFDKTGTLTRDGMVVRAVHTQGLLAPADALALAATLAHHSLHPVSRALVAAVQEQDGVALARWQISEVQETAGYGLTAQLHDAQGVLPVCRVLLGSPRHTGQHLSDLLSASGPEPGQQVVLAWQGANAAPAELARFDLSEDLRPDAAAAVQALHQAGIAVQLLSGDRSQAAAHIALQAGITQWQGDCTPQDKLVALQALQARGQRVAMVGDGLNDGPVLAGAHVSFAFGRAVPLAQSRSDFVVLGSNLSLIAQSAVFARSTLQVVRQNLWWAAGYNALSVPLAILGYMPAWLAGLGMAVSSLLVVLNAARLSRSLPALESATQAPLGRAESTTATLPA
ncbi:MAG: heavy metal translocating P-type ATPase, partial [Simplicispira sp.]|nr:heavy metal translocating P-type ATPase [Simplicispira sp.]